jgi:DNA-binding SARP family transcriptional activator
LVEFHGRRGDHRSVCHHAERWIEIDRWNERAHRYLIRHLAADDRRGDAIAHGESLIETLRSDLGTAPDPETELLIQRIRRGH